MSCTVSHYLPIVNILLNISILHVITVKSFKSLNIIFLELQENN